MDHTTPKGNCGNNHRSGAADTQRTSASCLEFEGSFRQFAYDLQRDKKLRRAVIIGFIAAAIALIYSI
jgi:hypothetical protein